MDWPVATAAFLGAGIEFLETAAIAYALARAGHRREAAWGTTAGFATVALAAVLAGSSLRLVPLRPLQLLIGLLLLWFGGSWMRKAILRQARHTRAGWVNDPLAKAGIDLRGARFSKLNFLAMAKSAALEGLEAAIVLVTLGLASHAWLEVTAGALAALLATLLAVALLHGHLRVVPEVLIKLGAGILLTSFGIFWIGEGTGIPWPLGDAILLALVALLAGLSALAIPVTRKRLTGGTP